MDPIYVVTDIEADGPTPGRNSMLSFASVAVTAGLEIADDFEAVLAPLEGAAPDPDLQPARGPEPRVGDPEFRAARR